MKNYMKARKNTLGTAGTDIWAAETARANAAKADEIAGGFARQGLKLTAPLRRKLARLRGESGTETTKQQSA